MKDKREPLSKTAEEILMKRKKAIEHQNAEDFESLNQDFKKQKRRDRTEQILETLDKDLDCRDQWMGIKRLKEQYQPNPYHRKTKEGTHIKKEERAKEAAKYLSKEQWGINEEIKQQQQREGIRKDRIIEENENYNTQEITLQELKQIIKKFKRRKAPGPDEIPMEIFKEMDDENLANTLELLNQWWKEEKIPEETLNARVVMIYKKGDTSKYENYRPISLLNSIYKIYTAIIQRRLAEKLDKHLQKTQYGFRKDKSTADAIHLIRRISEQGHQTNNKLHMVLLDWEKSIR